MKLTKSFMLFMLFFTISGSAFAGEFRVTPIRLEFEKGSKSGVISVSNEGDEALNMQITAMEWTQDEAGKDVYTETSDIIYYPKIMPLEKGEKRAIRVGIKTPSPLKEKTYRLFIEEIPKPREKTPGAQVAVSVRFGVPLFIKPAREDLKGEIVKIELAGGSLSVLVRNTGNVHFMINSFIITGKDSAGQNVFSKEIAGWYLLSGASRTYSADIPADVCQKMERLEVLVKSPTLSLEKSLNINKEMCLK